LLVVFAIAQERVGTTKAPNHNPSCVGLVVTPVDNVVTFPNDLIEAIIGTDVTSYTLTSFQAVTGSEASAGLYIGGTAAGIEIEEGIVLSSGWISDAIGPNSSGSTSRNLPIPGDASLNALIPPYSTNDATVLQFDFVPTFNQLFIHYVFGSEEYNEYVGSQYNDVFAFFLNGTNIALIPSTTIPVAINNVNLGSFPAYYRNNAPGPYCVEMDGFTTSLVASANVNPNVTNTIKIAVGDVQDSSWDSWVFIEGDSFGGVDPEVPISNWALYIGIFLILTFAVIRFRKLV
jgi:hypothetical protein